MKIIYNIKNEDIGENLLVILKKKLYISSRLLRKLKLNRNIYIDSDNDITVKYIIEPNNKVVTVNLDDFEEKVSVECEDIPIDILYEDEYILAVNKDGNMATHPCAVHKKYTLANAVASYYKKNKRKCNLHIVNRLDRETSGIVLFAKHEYIQTCLSYQMKLDIMEKEYIGIVDGIVNFIDKKVILPIGREEGSIITREVNIENGSFAQTDMYLIKTFEDRNYSSMRFILKTGKTHQIRVHCKAIGHSILSDGLYGKRKEYILRQALHSYRVSFIHPITNIKIDIIAPIKEDMKDLI